MRAAAQNHCPHKAHDAEPMAIAKSALGCRGHWFALPKPVRDEVWRLWRESPGSEPQRALAFRIIAAWRDGKAPGVEVLVG